MIPSTYRPSKVVVDLNAIISNVDKELKRLRKNQELFAVVKANGYGHGAVQVAEAAITGGATGLCVSNLDEALELRRNNITLPIIVLSYVAPEYSVIAQEYNIVLTATSLSWLKQASKCVTSPLTIHLKIDSGMGRLGISTKKELGLAKKLMDESEFLKLEGIFTHFATADSQDISHFHLQQERFNEALSIVGTDVKYIHTSNSATALWHEAWESNLIRFGDAMYGLNPSGHELEPPYELKQALTLETQLIHVKKMLKGEKIGYGATYETTEDEWIGTLPIGYADGLNRRFQGFDVLVDGMKAPIVGRVCMDQCMIKLPKKLPIGTTVTIFGENNNVFNSIQSGADHIGTINYEVTCALTDRLPREYVLSDSTISS